MLKSFLDWDLFHAANVTVPGGLPIVDDAFYIYEANPTSGTPRYRTITSGAQDIPHSQGFWVKKTSAGDNDLTFNINQTIVCFGNYTFRI